MKLEDPELAALVDAYRDARRPSDAARRQMRARLGRTTTPRPAWQVYGVTAALAAAALLVIWLGARVSGDGRHERNDGTAPAQAPHEATPPRDDGHASLRDNTTRASQTVDEPEPEAPTVEARIPELPPPREIEPRPTPPTPKPDAPPPIAPDTDTPDDELTLIVQAEAALRVDQPERALRLLQLHQRRHPDANTKEERLALRVLALCALGRLEEGRGLRHTFLQQYERSAYRTRIESACPRK